jgi:MarR family transcriptional regulator for hemolysin
MRTADAFVAVVDRGPREAAGLSASAFQALAILAGADEPLTVTGIAERLLVSGPSMTSVLDTLERRGLVDRRPHPTDRRKVLIHLTDQARGVVDATLPLIHGAITEALADLPERERERLITSLTKIRSRLGALADQPPPPHTARRKRPA